MTGIPSRSFTRHGPVASKRLNLFAKLRALTKVTLYFWITSDGSACGRW